MSEATPILATAALAQRCVVSEEWAHQQARDCYRGFEHELNPEIQVEAINRSNHNE